MLQTKDLLEHGKTKYFSKALNRDYSKYLTKGSTLRAHASGTMPAHATGVSGGVVFYKGNDYFKGNTANQNAYANAVNNATGAVQENADAAEKSTEKFDWIERSLTYYANAVKLIADQITDYVSNAFKTKLLKTQYSYLDTEIQKERKGAESYRKAADGAFVEYKGEDGKYHKVGVSENYKKLVQSGQWYIESMDTSTADKKAIADAIQLYQDYWDKAVACDQAVQELTNTQLELTEQLMNMPIDNATDQIEKLNNAYKSLDTTLSNLSGGSAVKMRKTVQQTYINATQNALDDYKTFKTNNFTNGSQKTLNDHITKIYNNKSTKASTKSLIDELRTYTTKGKKIPDSVMKKLSGYTLTYAKQYNADLDTLTGKSKTYQSKKAYSDAIVGSPEYNPLYVSRLNNYNSSKTAVKTALKGDKNEAEVLKYVNANTVIPDSVLKKLSGDALKNAKAFNTQRKSYESLTGTEKNAFLSKNGFSSDASYAFANALLDAQTAEKEKEKNLRVSAVATTTANKKAKEDAIKTAESTAFKKALKKAGITNYTSGEQIQITNSMKTTLTSDELETIRKYNVAIQEAKIANDANTQSVNDMNDALAELADVKLKNALEKLDNVKNWFDSNKEYLNAMASGFDSQQNLIKSKGISTASEASRNTYYSTLRNAMTTELGYRENAQTIASDAYKAYEREFNSLVAQGILVANTEEWWEAKKTLMGLKEEEYRAITAVRDLNDEIRKLEITEAFEDARASVERFKSSLSGIRNLISEEMLYDDNGNLTNFGMTALALDVKSYEQELATLSSLVDERNKIAEQYASPDNADRQYSYSEYLEDVTDVENRIQQALGNANNARKAITNILINQSKLELEAITKVVDKTKEALQKKKDYWSFDREVKDATKNINSLKAQIAALEGVGDAYSKAKRAQLEAELQEAEQDFGEKIRDHRYELEIAGLDDLKESLQTNYENYVKDLNSNLTTITKAVTSATDTINDNLGTVSTAIKAILNSFHSGVNMNNEGVNKTWEGLADAKNHAKGTSWTKQNRIARTNEAGDEIFITPNGIYVPMKNGIGVAPAQMTSNLLNMAAGRFPMPQPYIPAIPDVQTKEGNNNIVNNIDASITVQGNVDKRCYQDIKELVNDRDFRNGVNGFVTDHLANEAHRSGVVRKSR